MFRAPAATLAQPVAEGVVTELLDQLELVAVAVPEVDAGQLDAVEGVGLDHRIMCLVEEGETLADLGPARNAVIADDVPCQA